MIYNIIIEIGPYTFWSKVAKKLMECWVIDVIQLTIEDVEANVQV
jgi:hypothetical protein